MAPEDPGTVTTLPSRAGGAAEGCLDRASAPEPSPVRAPLVAWEPRVVGFFCNWCTYTAADLAGISRLQYAPNVRIVRVLCSGRMDPQFVMHAFAQGADGVLIGGCHPNDCHYLEGNCAALRRFRFLRRLLGDLGIHPDRLRLEWISASEADKVRWAVGEMVDQLRRLGPLALPDRLRDLDAPTLAYSASQEVVHEQ